MSVINDMLKDLDKRQAPEVGSSQALQQEGLIEPQSSPLKKIIMITLFVLCLLCLLFVAVFLFLKGDRASLEPALTLDNARHVNEQTNTLNVPQNTSQVMPQESTPNSDGQNNDVLEKSINTIQAKPVDIAVPEIKNIKESRAQALEEKEKEKENDTGRQQKQVERKPLVVSKSANTSLEIAKPQKAIVQVQKVKPKIKIEEQKAMQVTLSPTALDQQMAERALALISETQETQAYRELYTFIGGHEEDMESRTVLATYLLQENRLAEVGDVLLNAPLHKSPKLRQIKARWYAEQGKPKLALYTLSSDLPQIEIFPEYYVLLAAYYQRYGTAKEAKEAYSTLVDYDETVADWWAGLGLASDRNKEKNKAVYAYQQSLGLKGLSPELLNFVKPRLEQLLASNLN